MTALVPGEEKLLPGMLDVNSDFDVKSLVLELSGNESLGSPTQAISWTTMRTVFPLTNQLKQTSASGLQLRLALAGLGKLSTASTSKSFSSRCLLPTKTCLSSVPICFFPSELREVFFQLHGFRSHTLM